MMKQFKLSLAAVTLFASLSSFGEILPFSQEKYDMVVKQSHPVLLDFHASWCPTCKKQEKIITELAAMPEYKNLTVFKVDYDSAKDLKKSLNVNRQSTLVLFKANKEIVRKTGITSKEDIKALIDLGK